MTDTKHPYPCYVIHNDPLQVVYHPDAYAWHREDDLHPQDLVFYEYDVYPKSVYAEDAYKTEEEATQRLKTRIAEERERSIAVQQGLVRRLTDSLQRAEQKLKNLQQL